MSGRSDIRRVAVFACLAALLLAGLVPGTAGLALAFLVVTVWFLVGIALVVLLPHGYEDSHAQQALASAVFSPRPPPTR